jgi:nucleoside-diphosphate-sugar epimerase
MVWDEGAPEIGRVYSDAFAQRFGPARAPGDPLDARHHNLAASVQALAEEVYFHVLQLVHDATRLRSVCVAGGVAYNSVANGKIRARTPFERVFIQPAAGDAGTALGAAFAVWHKETGAPRRFVMRHSAWGPEYSEEAVAGLVADRAGDLRKAGASVHLTASDDELCRRVAAAIADGKVVGWFQGRMEWGARALGHRSILADPRRAAMKDVLNERIKRREAFRPFCPSILEPHVADYFEGAHPDPFMLSVYPIRPEKRASIPAVTHVDGTGRLQSVREQDDPLYWRLLQAFHDRTGVPVLLNTSFNENEPIVRTPDEALDCFLRTRMDVLAIGRHVVERVAQASEGAGSMNWKWNDSLVVVTGGASFIGSHLVDALVARGASVRVVDNLSSGRLANIDRHVTSRRVEFVEADLKEPGAAEAAVQGARVVFHLAADHGGRGYVDLHQAACATNLMLDGLVFHACHKAKVEKVVYASSGCVYPNHLQTNVNEALYLTEDMVGPPYDADNMYGWAKLMAEMTLRSYYQDWGMKSVSCRYFTVYGDRGHENHAVIAMIARAFVRQDPFVVWGNGEQIRNWTHVSDIVSGTILAAERIDDGRAINLGTMERTRVIDAVREVMRCTGHHAAIELHPEMPTGPMNRVADNSLAKTLLAWEPQVRFMDGLRRTIDWYFATKEREQVGATLATRLTER